MGARSGWWGWAPCRCLQPDPTTPHPHVLRPAMDALSTHDRSSTPHTQPSAFPPQPFTNSSSEGFRVGGMFMVVLHRSPRSFAVKHRASKGLPSLSYARALTVFEAIAPGASVSEEHIARGMMQVAPTHLWAQACPGRVGGGATIFQLAHLLVKIKMSSDETYFKLT